MMTRTLTTAELDYLKADQAARSAIPPQRLADLGLVVRVATAYGPAVALTETGQLVKFYAMRAEFLESKGAAEAEARSIEANGKPYDGKPYDAKLVAP